MTLLARQTTGLEMQDHLWQTELLFPDERNLLVEILIVLTNLSILKISIHLLWLVEEIQHLPESKFKIHVPKVENPPQILKKQKKGRKF